MGFLVVNYSLSHGSVNTIQELKIKANFWLKPKISEVGDCILNLTFDLLVYTGFAKLRVPEWFTSVDQG